ncbi:DUF4198 domain-containing protein [Henriciella marina]|uniref:DUF4198 domain-containing protein n=1 Tax=Henriciella marina TaxID=453851 RepID=UPI00037C91D2|nr:DUF4198 domain-containing protein [Henriciella marina]
MWRTLTLSLMAASGAAGIASAHDFWVEPETFTPEAGQSVALNLFVGHGAEKSGWPVKSHRVIGLRSVGPDGLVNQASGAASLRPPLSAKLDDVGTHVVFVETTNSFSELEAEKFNDYVANEGIRPIALERVRQRMEDAPGRELYSRRGKAVVQVGCPSSDNGAWKQEIGLTLEIIPGKNPVEWDTEDPMPLKVMFHGEPVAGATLHITNLDDDTLTFSAETGSDGRTDIAASLTEGRWLVHTVWAEPAEGLLENADFQTVFSSITFDTEDPCPN